MFSREDFEALQEKQLTDWQYIGGCPGFYYVTYPPYAFESLSSEEYIRITRAPNSASDGGLKFWLSAEWADDWAGREGCFGPYLRDAEFAEISEDRFNEIVRESSSSLVAPLSLPIRPSAGFVGALIMSYMNGDLSISLFAEYEDEFIHYYWQTTA